MIFYLITTNIIQLLKKKITKVIKVITTQDRLISESQTFSLKPNQAYFSSKYFRNRKIIFTFGTLNSRLLTVKSNSLNGI